MEVLADPEQNRAGVLPGRGRVGNGPLRGPQACRSLVGGCADVGAAYINAMHTCERVRLAGIACEDGKCVFKFMLLAWAARVVYLHLLISLALCFIPIRVGRVTYEVLKGHCSVIKSWMVHCEKL